MQYIFKKYYLINILHLSVSLYNIADVENSNVSEFVPTYEGVVLSNLLSTELWMDRAQKSRSSTMNITNN